MQSSAVIQTIIWLKMIAGSMSASRILWILYSPQKCLDEWHMLKKKWTIFSERIYSFRNELALKTALLYTPGQSGQLGHVWSRPVTLTKHLLWTPHYFPLSYEFCYNSLLFPLSCLTMPLLSVRLCRCMTHNRPPTHPNSPHFSLGHLTIHYALPFVDFSLISSFMHFPSTITPHMHAHQQRVMIHLSLLNQPYLTWWITITQNWSWAMFWDSCFWLFSKSFFPLSSSHSPKVSKALTVPQPSSAAMAFNPGLQPEGINLRPPSLTSSYSTKEHICSVS